MGSSVRIFFASCFAILLFASIALFPKASFAQTLIPTQSVSPTPFPTLSPTPSVLPNTQHIRAQTTMLDVMSAITCELAGVDASDPNQPCVGSNPVSGRYGYVQSSNLGLLGMAAGGINAMYTIPAHTGDYVHYLAGNFGVSKGAYAASQCSDPTSEGTGFCDLYPLIGIWTVFRNLAYLGFVAVFILIGFAIMLRLKLKPQTAVSIQNQIPRIIIAIILITFSYAIAGFLIDMMYVSIGVVINLGQEVDPKGLANVTTIKGDNPFSFYNSLFGNDNDAVINPLSDAVLNTSDALGNATGDIVHDLGTPGQIIVAVISGIVGGMVGGSILGTSANPLVSILGPLAIGGIFAAVGGFNSSGVAIKVGQIVGIIIIFVAIFVTLIRVWIILLNAYIHILIDVVFGPIYILFSAIPKSKFTLNNWLRDLIGHLAVFPVLIGMFVLAKVFIDAIGTNGTTTGSGTTAASATLWTPPLIGGHALSNANTLSGLIGLGFLLLTPSALKLTRSMFGTPKTSMFQNTFEGLALGARVGGGIWGQTGGKAVGVDKNGQPGFLRGWWTNRRMDAAADRQQNWANLKNTETNLQPGEKLSDKLKLGQRVQLRLGNMGEGISNTGLIKGISSLGKTSMARPRFEKAIDDIHYKMGAANMDPDSEKYRQRYYAEIGKLIQSETGKKFDPNNPTANWDDREKAIVAKRDAIHQDIIQKQTTTETTRTATSQTDSSAPH